MFSILGRGFKYGFNDIKCDDFKIDIQTGYIHLCEPMMFAKNNVDMLFIELICNGTNDKVNIFTGTCYIILHTTDIITMRHPNLKDIYYVYSIHSPFIIRFMDFYKKIKNEESGVKQESIHTQQKYKVVSFTKPDEGWIKPLRLKGIKKIKPKQYKEEIDEEDERFNLDYIFGIKD
jgi:hypothetical protein